MNVALTQRVGQLEGLHAAIEAIGHTVIRAPLIAVTFERDVDLTPLEACPWWLFTSSSAVAALAQLGKLQHRRDGIASVNRVKLAAVGETTAAALRQSTGLEVDLLSPDGTAQGLARALLETSQLQTSQLETGQLQTSQQGPFGWPHGDRALPDLHAELSMAGATVYGVIVYRTVDLAFPSVPAPDVVVLASPSAARNLPPDIGRAVQIIALGTSTAAAARARGWRVFTAAQPTVRAVLDVLQRLEARQGPSHVNQEPALSEMESPQCQN